MSKKFKKMLSVICAVCLFVNLLMVHASGDMHLEMGTIEKSNRVPILTLTPGSGAGQVGYGGSEEFGYMGPDSFAVEDGVVYILDGLNRRVLVFGTGRATSIDISDIPIGRRMLIQNGMIAVTDNTTGVTGVYTTGGTKVALIEHPDKVVDEAVVKLVELGDTYVVWKTYESNFYRYDWATKTLGVEQDGTTVQFMTADADVTGTTRVSSVANDKGWQIASENKMLNMLGAKEEALVYVQHEYVPDVDMFFTEMSVRKALTNGAETYAIIDFSEWRSHALEPVYYSSDGEAYLLECFEDKTVISKLVFGTTDVSKMPELELQAEARRQVVAAEEAAAELRSIPIASAVYDYSRKNANTRALAMINYEWTVLANHKTLTSSDVIIPSYVAQAAVGSKVKGIPYCWGGYNGYSTDGSYGSFASKVTQTGYMAGNTKTVNTVWNTIGLDCSGFVISVYGFASGTKYNTTSLASFGNAVSSDALKPMDFLVKAGDHAVIYAGTVNGSVKKYEACVLGKISENEYANGYTMVNECSVSSMTGGGYVCRTPFCTSCNALGVKIVTDTVHVNECSVCEYEWPAESHNQNGEWESISLYRHARTCSECEYVWASVNESHFFTGAYTYDEYGHYQHCRECGQLSGAMAHSFEYYGECNECGYIGEQIWP